MLHKVITFREEVNLKVYPNPMKSISSFELEGINGKDGILQVFDSMGRLVKEKSFSQNKFQLSRDNLPSGNYFFKIGTDQIPILATGMLQVID